jgi:O-antigen/teichoic acid export membrane protein
LIGLQKQVWYNAVNAALATVRSIGAVAILAWVSPNIEAFFIWQALVSVLTVLILAVGLHRFLPVPPKPPIFSTKALIGVWIYARGMAVIVFLSLLLTQVDKVLLSRLLPLETFGIYTLAATVSGALYMVITPIITAIYPRFVELSSRHETETLISTYHYGAQFLIVLTAPIAIVIALFGEGVLFAWSGDPVLAHAAGPILSVLVLGTFLNGLMNFPYHLQLAYGWTSLTIKINIVAVLLVIPAILWAVPVFGAVAAAWIWALLNTAYLLSSAQFMHRKLLPNEKWNWYIYDLVFPIIGASSGVLLIASFRPEEYLNRWNWLGFLLLTFILGIIGATFASSQIRARVMAAFRPPRPAQKAAAPAVPEEF